MLVSALGVMRETEQYENDAIPGRQNGPQPKSLDPYPSCLAYPNETLRKTMTWGIGYFIGREKAFAAHQNIQRDRT